MDGIKRPSEAITNSWAAISGHVDDGRYMGLPVAVGGPVEKKVVKAATRSILTKLKDDTDSLEVCEHAIKMEASWPDSERRASPQQIRRWGELFVLFDADESGGLDSAEIGSLMRSLNPPFKTIPQSRIEDMFDELPDDTDQMDLKVFLETMLRVLHYPGHYGRNSIPTLGTTAFAKLKPAENLRETILTVYRELELPADNFLVRCNPERPKKDQPKEREYYERMAQMLVDLQDQNIREAQTVKDFQCDLDIFGNNLDKTSNKRQQQLKHQIGREEEYKMKNKALREELEKTRREIDGIKAQQKDCMSSIDHMQNSLTDERDNLQLSLERSMNQVRVDQQSAAAFMARMLKNDERISALEQYVPRYEALKKAYEDTEEENMMLMEVLQEVHAHFESNHAKEVQSLETSRQAGAELEAALIRVRDAHTEIARDAAVRVEDALPFHKVPRGQDALARRLGAL